MSGMLSTGAQHCQAQTSIKRLEGLEEMVAKSHVIFIFHGQQVKHCEQEVKDFVHAKGCFRAAAYKTLHTTIKSPEPLHDCCSFSSIICQCTVLPFEAGDPAKEDTVAINVTEGQITPTGSGSVSYGSGSVSYANKIERDAIQEE